MSVIDEGMRIIYTLIIGVSLFAIVNFGVNDTREDIINYMEDHQVDSRFPELFALALFLIVFYILPALIPLKYILPEKFKNYPTYRLYLGISFAIGFIFIILFIIFPFFATMEGPERDGIWWRLFVWLFSIFIISVLFIDPLFSDKLEEKFAKSSHCQKIFKCIWERLRLD